MKFNRGKVLFVFAVLLMFTLQGELAAQSWNWNWTLTITPTGQSIKVGDTLNLTATAMWGTSPFKNIPVNFSVIQGDGSVLPLVDTTDAQGIAYTVFTAGTSAGINKVYGCYDLRLRCYACDTVDIEVIAGDIDHFDLVVVSPDTLNVGEYAEIEITAKDSYGNTITDYADSVTISLTGSTADSSQVAWVVMGDTLSGLSAAIPENSFAAGICTVYVASQKAETVSGVTAADTESHTGTSSEITWLAIGVDRFLVEVLSAKVDTINVNDTTEIQVTAVDAFGNITSVGLPMDVELNAVEISGVETGVVFPDGTTQTLENAVDSFSFVAQVACSGLIIRVISAANPGIYGNSNPIEVVEVVVVVAGVEEIPVVSNISVKFGSGEILYSVAEVGNYVINVYNKAGMEVGTLVNGEVNPGYHQASLEGLNLSSDIYFVVMIGPDIKKGVKTVLIE